MTTIAARIKDNKIELAADSIIVRGTLRVQEGLGNSKIFDGLDCVVASTGLLSESSLFELFCRDHSIGKGNHLRVLEFLSEFSRWKENNGSDNIVDNNYIIGHKSGLYRTHGLSVLKVDKYCADGHGMDYAEAGLHLGKSAKDAVQLACELDVYTNGPVITKKNKLGE